MSTLDPSVKNLLLVVMLIALSFVLFIIIIVLTYKKRQTRFVIEAKLKEAELNQIKLESQIETLKAINIEKERISADIHDDMGGNVSSINLLSKLIQGKTFEEDATRYVKEIQTQSFELSQKMKDIVWATKSENDHLENLFLYIHQYAVKQLEPLGFIVQIHKPILKETLMISGEMRKDIFMTVKECINNIIKHSGAKRVEIDLLFIDYVIQIFIHDDGKGLTDTIQYGNGLKQMVKRIEKHKGQIKFHNMNGSNISIELDLNLHTTKV